MTDYISRADAIEAVRGLSVLVDDEDFSCFEDALNALPSADATDVYKAHEEEHLTIVNRIKELQYAIAKTQTIIGELVESAEAEPTVIRSRTLMPTKDFKEWAKRVRETNPNVIVIPCDAEVVSADAVQGEWEFVDNEIFAGEYFCSVCGKRAEVDLYGEWILSNYCPSCGARMLREDGEV